MEHISTRRGDYEEAGMLDTATCAGRMVLVTDDGSKKIWRIVYTGK